MSKPITTLLHFSGGQDSTYVAYKWLKEHPDEILLLHHVNLKHEAENRLMVERTAVHNSLNYFKRIGLSNFIYLESSFDYGDLPRISIKDIQIVALFTSVILKTPQYNTIDKLLLSWHKGEVNREDIRKGYRVRKMLDALEVDRPIEFVFPIEYMTRKEMFNDTPKELMKYMWSCRKPKNGSHCSSCKTCRELKEEGILKYFK